MTTLGLRDLGFLAGNAEIPVSATGGTESTVNVGGIFYRVHQFTSVGTSSLTVTSGGNIEYLIIGGGGGGGQGYGSGGGAGGYREGSVTISPGVYSIVVGDGGLGSGVSNTIGNSGNSSSFYGITAAGGGYGGAANSQPGGAGGSGGGGGSGNASASGGNGNTPATTPAQGNNGAPGVAFNYGGGGGGAGSAGSGKAGGSGKTSTITGVAVGRAGGGSGNSTTGLANAVDGGGGLVSGVITAAQPNTGGGGTGDQTAVNAKGGSGIVIVRYRNQPSSLLFLDLYPGAIAAYSLRSLSSGSSSVIRVRRNSDNTEQDFTATQITDGTLAAFCGSGSGFVRTWYDQTLNANHAIMTTNELQPIIFNSGSLVTQGSRPALLFPSANVFQTGTGLAGRARLDSYIVKNTTDTSYIFVSSSDANIYGPACDSILTGSSTTLSSNYGAPSFYANGTLFSGTTRTQLQSFYNGYKIEVHENASTLSWPNFDIGLYARQSNNLWYEGTLQEAVFYANNQSVNRVLMQNSINSYYSVY